MSQYLGIDWGKTVADPNNAQFTQINFYSDAACKVQTAIIQQSNQNQDGVCVDLADLTKKGFNRPGPGQPGGFAIVGSVMGVPA